MGVNARRYPATFSDLALLPPGAELWHGSAGMVAVRCPARPDYADGHAVYVPVSSALDLEAAVQLWHEHIGELWTDGDMRLCVEGPGEVLQTSGDADWHCERRVVLQQRADRTRTFDGDSHIRRCERLAEWEALLALWATAHPVESSDFVVWRAEQLRRKGLEHEGGMWAWFDEDRALAGAGAYRTGPLFRLQEVVTHPEHRRRGLAAALCRRLVSVGGDAIPTVVAHHGSPGQRLYESLGFCVVGEQHVLTARADG